MDPTAASEMEEDVKERTVTEVIGCSRELAREILNSCDGDVNKVIDTFLGSKVTEADNQKTVKTPESVGTAGGISSVLKRKRPVVSVDNGESGDDEEDSHKDIPGETKYKKLREDLSNYLVEVRKSLSTGKEEAMMKLEDCPRCSAPQILQDKTVLQYSCAECGAVICRRCKEQAHGDKGCGDTDMVVVKVEVENDEYKKINVLPSRSFDTDSELDRDFRIAEGHFLRMVRRRKNYEIKSIDIIRNEKLKQRFEQKKQEFKMRGLDDKPLLIFHGTPQENIEHILRENFDLSKVANGRKFGNGVYFSEVPEVSMKYTRDQSSLILCMVLQGDNSKEIKISPTGFQAIDAQNSSIGALAIVVPDVDQILPKYVINFTDKPRDTEKQQQVINSPGSQNLATSSPGSINITNLASQLAAGFLARQIRAPSFSSSPVSATRFSVSQVPAVGFSAPSVPVPAFSSPHVPTPGVTAPALVPPVPAPAFSAPPVPAPAISAPPFPAPGYSAPAVPAPGYSAPPVPAPGYPAPPVAAPGFSASPVPAPAPGFSAPPVTAPGFSAPPVTAPGFSAPPVPASGFSAAPLVSQMSQIMSQVSQLMSGMLQMQQTMPQSMQGISQMPQTMPGMSQITPGMQQTMPVMQQTMPVMQHGTPGMQQTMPVMQHGTPGMQQTMPVVQHATPGMQQTMPVVQHATPGMQQTMPVMQHATPGIKQTMPVMQHATPGMQPTMLQILSPMNQLHPTTTQPPTATTAAYHQQAAARQAQWRAMVNAVAGTITAQARVQASSSATSNTVQPVLTKSSKGKVGRPPKVKKMSKKVTSKGGGDVCESASGSENPDSSQVFHCDVCDVRVATKELMEEHKKGREHRMKERRSL